MTEAGWTREKPSKEGVYWFRWTVNSNSLIVSVAKDDCDWRVLEMGHQYDGALAGYGDGEWLGPITPESYQHGRAAGARECVEKVRARAALWRAHGGAKIGFPYGHLTVEGECDSIADELGKLAQQAQNKKGVWE